VVTEANDVTLAGAPAFGRGSLGRIGIFTVARQWPSDPGAVAAVAAELEDLGFRTLWLGGSVGQFPLAHTILTATSSLVVATGIVQIYANPASDVAAAHHDLTSAYPGRFLLGIGPGHAHSVEASGMVYERPYSKLVSYLDELDHAPRPVPDGQRVLAALGPRALRLASDRATGAHPFNVSPEHTAQAREIMGPDALLAPEHKVFFEQGPSEAREGARQKLAIYLEMPNYLNNLRRLGFDDGDFSGGGSDRLMDTLVAWGSTEAVVARIREHLDAGADHVAVQVLDGRDLTALPLDEWREAAPALLS